LSAWTLPASAGAFWLGLLGWPMTGGRISVALWIVAGIVAVGIGLALLPAETGGAGPLESVGLVPAAAGNALERIAPPRLEPGRGPPVVAALTVLLGVACLGVGWGGFHEHRTEGAFLARLAPARVEVEGTLRTDPSPGTIGWSAVIAVGRVRWDGREVAVRETLWLDGQDEIPEAVRGDRLIVGGQVLVPDDPGFASSLLRRGIPAELRTSSVERVGPSTNPFMRAAQGFRTFVGRSIGRLFGPREAGLLMGLALGDDSRLDPAVARDFHATGLGHLLVVSGENVAMVLGPVLGLAMLLRLSRVPRFLLGLGTVVFFVVLTGAEPSVMRAGVMASIALGGMLLGRPRSAAAILAGAVLVLLIVDPALVWAVGFQLSVVATAGMVALASSLAERLRFLPRSIALATGATLAAQLGVTPILLFHFHEVPVVTLAANVLAFPAVSPALLLGLLAAGVGLVSVGVGRLLAAVATLPMRYLELLADRLARAPIPWITSHGGIVNLVVGLAIVCATAWALRARPRLPRHILVAGALVIPLLVWSSALSAGPPSGLVVRFFDVGQGDAALVSSPGGANILIDGGPDPEQVATELSALGVKRLDVVIATHPHADHIVGLPAVLARFPVDALLDPGCADESPIYADLVQAIADEHVPVRHPRAGDSLTVGDLRLDVVSPQGCWHDTESDANNDSLVVMVSLGDDSVLFAAEPEEPAQQVLLDEGVSLGADVLKVPHHGGATSLPAFFEAVRPQLAVVSVGPNTYGHPVPEVLDWIAATGAEIRRTDLDGEVTVTFEGPRLLVESAA
jgi:competence protein ComEC